MRTIFLVTISSIICTVTSLADYNQEAEKVGQACYSCSGESALCRNEVYDGTYLTKSPCRTKCFVRREDKNIYRGCFDGWLGGMVKYNYEGCRVQKYLGQEVEWCFCSGNGNLDEEPCNYISPRDMGSNRPEMSYSSENEIDNRFEDQSGYNSFQGMPVADYKQFMNYATGKSSKSNIEAKEAPVIRQQKYKLQCYECHDGFPYCGKHITRPDYIALKGCKSQCFIRKEGKNMYRGCFDGWLKANVKHNYQGCEVQDSYGTKTEWCFCNTNLCNGRSMDDMGESRSLPMSSLYVEEKSYPYAQDYSTFKKIDAKEGSSSSEAKFGVADVYDNNVYNYAPAGRISPKTMCQGLPNGVYTDPFDCVMYINCLNGYTYRRRCPPGTAWNSDTGFCDYAHKVAHMCHPRKQLGQQQQQQISFNTKWMVDESEPKREPKPDESETEDTYEGIIDQENYHYQDEQ